MFLIKCILFIYGFYVIESAEYTVKINKVTKLDVLNLKIDYPNMKDLEINYHPFYANNTSDKMRCPQPWSHRFIYKDLYYEKIEMENKLFNVIDACLSIEKNILAYAIFLNAIESIGITYIYDFCHFARELNRFNARIDLHLSDFNKTLNVITKSFDREIISSEPIKCIKQVLIDERKKNKLNIFDQIYRKNLHDCITLMEKKIDFVKWKFHYNEEKHSIDDWKKLLESASEFIIEMLGDKIDPKVIEFDKGKEKSKH